MSERVIQIAGEVVSTNTSHGRTNQVGAELISANAPNERISQIGLELISPNVANARLNQIGYEVIYLNSLGNFPVTLAVDSSNDTSFKFGVIGGSKLGSVNNSIDVVVHAGLSSSHQLRPDVSADIGFSANMNTGGSGQLYLVHVTNNSRFRGRFIVHMPQFGQTMTITV